MVVQSGKRHEMRHLDVFYRLLRDQEVDGSNPFAPTNLLDTATYKMRKSIERLVQGSGCRWLKSICHNHSLLFQINTLHGVLEYEFYFIFADNRYNLGVFVQVWQTAT